MVVNPPGHIEEFESGDGDDLEPQNPPQVLFGQRMRRSAFIKDDEAAEDDKSDARASGRPNNHSFCACEGRTMDGCASRLVSTS